MWNIWNQVRNQILPQPPVGGFHNQGLPQQQPMVRPAMPPNPMQQQQHEQQQLAHRQEQELRKQRQGPQQVGRFGEPQPIAPAPQGPMMALPQPLKDPNAPTAQQRFGNQGYTR
jgi:hypothetical protein